jgi:drug/metabolite transporter (DMT)-like permease
MSSNPILAALWMLGAALSFAAMAVAGREIMVELSTFELMLYRSIIGFFLVAALILRSPKGFAQVRTGRIGLHLTRNVFHFTGQNLWFFAVASIPLGQLVALEFTNPIWVALLSPFLLSEAFTRWRIAAALIGFAGVLIVARPGVTPIEIGHMAALGAAVGFAFNTIFTKQLSRTDSILNVLFWMTLIQAGFAFALSLPFGLALPSAATLPWIVVVGVCGLTAHFCLTTALAIAPASVVAPMEFIRLPIIVILGMVVYHEPFDIAVFIGAAVIFAGNVLSVRAERRRVA